MHRSPSTAHTDDARVDIGGRSLFTRRAGDAGPLVVLDSGLGATAGSWGPVFAAVARFARVLAYDRAGLGRSDAAPVPRSAAYAVGDLHELLATAEPQERVVLVGHSFGGAIAQLYAAVHPGDVSGLVLVDAPSGRVADEILALVPWDRRPQLETALRRNAEGMDLMVSAREIREAGDIPPIPTRVVSATRGHGGWGMEGETVEWLWGLMQQDLAELHPGVRHITAEAGHSIQWERPDVVVDAIRDVVRATEERPG